MVISVEVGFDILVSVDVDLVIFDMCMFGMNGVQFLVQVKQQWLVIMCILLIGYLEIGSIILVINDGGIYYYFFKFWEDCELFMIVIYVLEEQQLCKQKMLLECKVCEQNL